MRVPGQDHIEIGIAAADKSPLQVEQPRVDPIQCVANPQPQIGGHLIVAAAAGVQLPADIAEAVDERLLDVHVNVFELHFEWEIAGFDLSANLLQPAANLFALGVADKSDLCQHVCMGNRPGYVVRVEPMIEADAFGELLDAAVRGL
jgi:hypothetical protein